MSIDPNIKRALLEKDYRLIEPIIHTIGWIGILAHLVFYLLCSYVFLVVESPTGRILCALTYVGFLFLPKSDWNRFHKTFFEAAMVFTVLSYFSYMFLLDETLFWSFAMAFGGMICGIFVKPKTLFVWYLPAILLTIVVYHWNYGLDDAALTKMLEVQALVSLVLILALVLQVALVSTNYQLEDATRRAELANQAKSLFLANMSHEIRTPMAAILGYTEILLESSKNLSNLNPQTIKDHLRTVHRNAEHLLAILNDILDLSKIEAEKTSLDAIPCSLFDLAQDCQTLMRSKAEEKGLQLNIHFDSPIPESITTDPTRFRQILFNLVGNAVKFTQQGQIDIHFRLLKPKSQPPFLECQVHDTGPGMSTEAIRTVFEPFTQADNSITRQYGGTGLGLTISKRIAMLLGGDLTGQSQSGKGSVFSFTCNVGDLSDVKIFSQEEATRKYLDFSSEEREIPSFSKIELHGRVLLVEDAYDNQRLVKTLLTKLGLEVTIAENGQKGRDIALAAFQKGNPFDLVLMDIQMPIMDGYEATRQLRAQGYNRPIIALTANAMASDKRQCLDAGCNTHLAKPIQRKELIKTLSLYLGTTTVSSKLF